VYGSKAGDLPQAFTAGRVKARLLASGGQSSYD
jgi:hypothetical protein